jgi:outer membrane protein assembly factor BamB
MKKKAAGDMAELVGVLRANPKFRSVNCDKLQFLLERAELRVPARWPGNFDIRNIRAYDAAAPGTVPLPSRSVPRYARWALVPAFAAAAAVLFFLVLPQLSVKNDRTGTITRVSGSTTVSRPDGKGRLDAGDALAAGDVIITTPGSSLDISFNESIRMRVLGGSRITLRRVELDRRRVFNAMVSAGSCIMKVSKLSPGESVSLRTPTSEASVKGTAFGVSVSDAGVVRYEVYEGTVRVRRALPADSGVGQAASEYLSRYFRTHELMLEKGKACRIEPDAISLGLVKPRPDSGAIAGLSLPVVQKGPGALSMKDEAAMFAGIAPEPEGTGTGEDSGQTVQDPSGVDTSGRHAAEKEPSIMSGQQYLVYIPETDYILTIGESNIAASHAGKLLWRLDLDDAIASMPVREDGSIYFATVRGTVSRLDCASGTIQWTTLADSATRAPAHLALDGSGIYFAASQGVVGKLDRRGELQWKTSIGEGVSAAPVLSRHLVLVPTRKGVLVGIDKYRGLNAVRVDFSARIVSVGTRQDLLFVATEDGRLSAYSMKDQKVLWRYPVNDAFAGDMIIENDSIYLFGRAGKVHRVSMSGEQIWTRDTGNPIVKRPASDQECFYLPSEQTLCVINKISGDTAWSFMAPGIKSGNVAVSGGTIYFKNEKNGLTSLKK